MIEIFHSNEYKQISQPTIDSQDPVGHDLEELKGSLRPVSNLNNQSEHQQQVTVTTVYDALFEGLVKNSTTFIYEMSGICTTSDLVPHFLTSKSVM